MPNVIVGLGLTFTVISVGLPTHEPVVAVGVTVYTILPALELLGFVKVWLMLAPLLALAPVIEPVLVPNVHAKLLATEAVKLIFGLIPLQIDAAVALLTLGTGLTVIVVGADKVSVDGTHPEVLFTFTSVPVRLWPLLSVTVVLTGPALKFQYPTKLASEPVKPF